MKQSFKTLDECKGKKLVDYVFGHSSELLLVFEDGYLMQYVSRGYESGDESISWREMPPKKLVESFFSDNLIKVGVVTHEEHAELTAKNLKANAAARLSYQRQQYEQLKKQFEGS